MDGRQEADQGDRKGQSQGKAGRDAHYGHVGDWIIGGVCEEMRVGHDFDVTELLRTWA